MNHYKKIWQLQDAKNKLSEVVERALSEGPQLVICHGKSAAVVVAAHLFEQREKKKQVESGPRERLVELMRDGSVRVATRSLQALETIPNNAGVLRRFLGGRE